MSITSTESSAADVRNHLDPAAVDALADQLHALLCVPVAGPPPSWPENHRDGDRTKARFVLLGLREAGSPLGDELQAIAASTLEEIAEIGAEAEELAADASWVERDAIRKINAGAQLTFAVWSLPKDVVLDLFKNAPTAFQKAYMAATEAYGIGGN